MEKHGLDTDTHICFYENDYYIFSNFSSFAIEWKGKLYPTAEHAYHSEKFEDEMYKEQIRLCTSAHEAFKFANRNKNLYIEYWDEIKFDIMKSILMEKVKQHPYVLKKLLDSGTKILVENSWRDSVWGCGADGKGKNMMGELWMSVREEVKKNIISVYKDL